MRTYVGVRKIQARPRETELEPDPNARGKDGTRPTTSHSNLPLGGVRTDVRTYVRTDVPTYVRTHTSWANLGFPGSIVLGPSVPERANRGESERSRPNRERWRDRVET